MKEKEEKKILKQSETLFGHPEQFVAEREKTKEEKEIIDGIIANFSKFITGYGGTPLAVKPEHIHVLDTSKIKSDLERQAVEEKIKKGEGGWFIPDSENVTVVPHPARLKFAERVAHELLHLGSFNSSTIVRERNFLEMPLSGPMKVSAKKPRRTGFRVFGRETDYFRKVNEGIIQELTIRFDQEHFNAIPALSGDIQLRKEIRDGANSGPEEISSVATEKKGNIFETTITPYAYPDERKKLWEIIREISVRNPNEYKSPEDVFRLFARAVLDGRLLEVARVVEKTYRKGSFRKLGEISE